MLYFRQISKQFPEEYIVYDIKFLKIRKLAYIKIRYGKITTYDMKGNEIVKYDLGGLKGSFYDNVERKKYFILIENRINKYYSDPDNTKMDDDDDNTFLREDD